MDKEIEQLSQDRPWADDTGSTVCPCCDEIYTQRDLLWFCRCTKLGRRVLEADKKEEDTPF